MQWGKNEFNCHDLYKWQSWGDCLPLKYYKFIDNFYFKSVNHAEHRWFEVYTQVSTLSSLRVKHVFSISYDTIIFSMNSKELNSEL